MVDSVAIGGPLGAYRGGWETLQESCHSSNLWKYLDTKGRGLMETIKVGQTYSTRQDVLDRLAYTGILRRSGFPIPGRAGRFAWIARSGKYRFGVNTMSEDGQCFLDQRDHTLRDANLYGNSFADNIEQILFLRIARYGRDIFQFAGVFMPLREKCVYNVAAWKKVSDECLLPDGQWDGSKIQ